MSPELYSAIITGATIGGIIALPLLMLYRTMRLLLETVARSKLSLDEYLALLELEDRK